MKDELVGNEEQEEWWEREVVEEGPGNYTILSFLINELKCKGQVS